MQKGGVKYITFSGQLNLIIFPRLKSSYAQEKQKEGHYNPKQHKASR